MRILLIITRYNLSKQKATYDYLMPAGMAYILAVLKSKKWDVDVLNLNHCDGTIDEIIVKAFNQTRYDLVLTGGLSIHYNAVKNCVDSVRRHSPQAQIVLGGGIISSQPETMFKALNPDYLVIGEGELTTAELVRSLSDGSDLEKIDGLGYRDRYGKLMLNRARSPITEIDSLSWPDYGDLGFDEYLDRMQPSDLYYYDILDNPRAYPLISSRSCPYSCTFCFHPIGNKYRQRTVANIIEEITFAINRYRVNIISIYDELFSHNTNRVLEFCEQIKFLSKRVSYEIKWSCQMRVDNLDAGLVTAMQEAGCYILSLGLESYNSAVLKSMNKKITPQDINRAITITREHNMTIQGGFIFGDIAETVDTARETLSYWKKSSYGGGINLDFITPYPGTHLYKHCVEKGIIGNELDYIANHMEAPLNLTKSMTEVQFKNLEIDIFAALRTYRKYVVPVKIKNAEVYVRCPYCEKISIYQNYSVGSILGYWAKDICCRECRMRFILASLTNKILWSLSIKLLGTRACYFLKKHFNGTR